MARTRSRTESQSQTLNENQVHPDYQSVESTDGVTFSSGNMIVNGAVQVPLEVEHWESSNGITNYATVKWHDPETDAKRCSCNCPGWAMKKPGKPRRCKHTDDMMGIKTCKAKKVDTIAITSVRAAEEAIPKFEGRELRGISFFDD